MAATSPVLLASVPNFRDLGGYRSECGGYIRQGLLYRSSDFSALQPHDLPCLERLEIRLLCDVRSERERRQAPNKWPGGNPPRTLQLNIAADLRASHEAITRLLSGTPNASNATQAMLVTYRLFPAAFAVQLGQLVECLLDDQAGLPLVFHCAAGKDRTGFIAAILLSALGIPREIILADYLLTAERWTGAACEAAIQRYLAPLCKSEPPAAVVRILNGVDTAYLEAAFAVIDQDFGGMERYMQRIGLDARRRGQLRERVLA